MTATTVTIQVTFSKWWWSPPLWCCAWPTLNSSSRGLEHDSKNNNVAHGSIPIRMALARGPLHEDLTHVPDFLTKFTVVLLLGRIIFDP